jgi:hypothetical protein
MVRDGAKLAPTGPAISSRIDATASRQLYSLRDFMGPGDLRITGSLLRNAAFLMLPLLPLPSSLLFSQALCADRHQSDRRDHNANYLL